MIMPNLDTISNLIEETENIIFKETDHKTTSHKYKYISEIFDKIMDIIQNNFIKESQEYFLERNKSSDHLNQIQLLGCNEIIKSINSMYNFPGNINFKVVPQSSFTGGINLIGDSDLDIPIFVENLDQNLLIFISNALGKCNYKFLGVENNKKIQNIYWVFAKLIQGVEIEAKLRDLQHFQKLTKIHNYINGIVEKDKALLTYAKYLIKKFDVKNYNSFKKIYYCNADYHSQTEYFLC